MHYSAADFTCPKLVQSWLLSCMGMVFLMVLVGGLTRLTESGLSITEWELFYGVMPPFDQAGWEEYFAKYKQSPEYLKINAGMSLSDFKGIFWLEYIHRVLGRITGLIFLLPLIALVATRQITKPVGFKMFGIGCLVACQGVVGWYMVASGLIDDPKVSPLKLSMHLTLAFIIFSLTLWTYLQHFKPHYAREASGVLYYGPRILVALTFVQVVLGGWVAGWDAGLIYNTYPLMDGEFIPSGMFPYDGFWANVISYVPLIQLQHRLGAKILLVAFLAFIWFAWRKAETKQDVQLLRWLLAAIVIQFALGVATLVYEVQIALASAHQMVALALLTVTILAAFRFSRVR